MAGRAATPETAAAARSCRGTAGAWHRPRWRVWRRAVGSLASGLVLCLAACGDPARAPQVVEPTPPRAGPFGSLRDFVLLQRPGPVGIDGEVSPGFFFLDRFEVTRADWAGFAATAAGRAVGAEEVALGGDPALPVARVDLRQARAFARWRFARLPRADEWRRAAVGDGRNRFPWGSKEDATRANTGDLGLGEPTPVGTFESGRRADGWPYDLVGNVSEWTETVPSSWFVTADDQVLDRAAQLRGSQLSWELSWAMREVQGAPALAVWQGPAGRLPLSFALAVGDDRLVREIVWSWPLASEPGAGELGTPLRETRPAWEWSWEVQQVRLSPALAVWQLPAGLVPSAWPVAGGGEQVPREVVGSDFLSPMIAQVELVPAGDRRSRTGLRLCTTPRELLLALLEATVEPAIADFEQLQRFVQRGRHRTVLQDAWRELRLPPTNPQFARPLGRWLQQQFGGGPVAGEPR